MSAGVLPPVLKMTLCRQRVRLAAVARLAGQHKVMHEVAFEGFHCLMCRHRPTVLLYATSRATALQATALKQQFLILGVFK